MDMEIIDKVLADEVEAGDYILFIDDEGKSLGPMEIVRIEEDEEGYIHLIPEEEEWTQAYLPFASVSIYGYIDD